MYGNGTTLSPAQKAQSPVRVLDKALGRRIIVRSFAQRKLYPKHKIRKTIKQSRLHEPAAKKGFRASLVQNFFRSGTLQPLCFLVFAQFGVRFTRTNIQRQTFTDSNFSHHMHRTKRCLRAFFYIGNSIKRNSKRRYDKKSRLKCRRRWSLKPKNAEAFFFYGRHSRFLRIVRNRSVLISSLHGCLRKLCVRIILMKIE